MGVRMAPGTTPAGLQASLLREGLLTVAAGAVAGVAGAVLSGRFLQSLIEGAQPDSAAIYAGTLLSIALIAAAGIWVATRPLARPDIVEILRAELPRATPGGGERRRRPNQQLEAERLRTAPVPPTCTP